MMATIKVNAFYTVKSYKNKLEKNSNRGARARRAGAGSAFVYVPCILTNGESVEMFVHFYYDVMHNKSYKRNILTTLYKMR